MNGEPSPIAIRIPCDICGAHDSTVVGKPKASADISRLACIPPDISVVRCNLCGFLYTDPMPFWGADSLQAIYGPAYFPNMTRWWEMVKTRANPQRRLDAIERHAGRDRIRFLEVGCGLGYGIEDAMRRGWAAHGQDVSRFFAAEAERRLGVKVFTGQLAEAAYPTGSFDAVYVDSVLEHLPRPMEMLSEIHRILRPGGAAYLTVTNEDALVTRLRGLLSRVTRSKASPVLSPLAYPVHLVGFTPATLALACERAGLEVVSLDVRAGRNEWRKYGLRSPRRLLSNLACWPVYAIGELCGKGIAIEAVVTAREQDGN